MSFQSGQGIPIVSEATKVAFAMPNGILFGLGYGTAIRVGYEILYPLLFPKSPDSTKTLTNSQTEVLSQMKTMYSTFGGLGAHDAGLEQGIKNAINSLGGALENKDIQDTLLKISGILAGTSPTTTTTQPPPETFGDTPETFTPSFPESTAPAPAPTVETYDTITYSYNWYAEGTKTRRFVSVKLQKSSHITMHTHMKQQLQAGLYAGKLLVQLQASKLDQSRSFGIAINNRYGSGTVKNL